MNICVSVCMWLCMCVYLLWTVCKEEHTLLCRSQQASLWTDAEGVISGSVMLDA